MDTKKLRHFVALAEWANFSAAANAVHLTQPAFSRSIQTLEDELGLELFDRSQRNVKLTSAGEQLLGYAQKILLESGNLVAAAGRVKNLEQGSLAIGAGPLPANHVGALSCAMLMTLHPKLDISLFVNEPEVLSEQLIAGKLDVIIVDKRTLPNMAELEFTPLQRQPGVTLARPGHPLAHQRNLSITDITQYPLATISNIASQIILQALTKERASAFRGFSFQCNSADLLKTVLKNSDAIGFLLKCNAEVELNHGELVILDLPELNYQIHSQYGATTFQPRLKSLALEAYLDICRRF